MEKKNNNIDTILILIFAVGLGVALTLLFQPDTTKDILKANEVEREIWKKEKDSIGKRIDSLLTLATSLEIKNELLQKASTIKYIDSKKSIKKSKNEEINNINSTNGEYLRILSASRSN